MGLIARQGLAAEVQSFAQPLQGSSADKGYFVLFEHAFQPGLHKLLERCFSLCCNGFRPMKQLRRQVDRRFHEPSMLQYGHTVNTDCPPAESRTGLTATCVPGPRPIPANVEAFHRRRPAGPRRQRHRSCGPARRAGPARDLTVSGLRRLRRRRTGKVSVLIIDHRPGCYSINRASAQRAWSELMPSPASVVLRRNCVMPSGNRTWISIGLSPPRRRGLR